MKAHEHITLESMSQALWYNQWTLNKFQHTLRGDILEIGCGIGNFTKTLIKYGHVWAFDINSAHLKKTAKKLKNKAQIGPGDIEKHTYFFKKRSFDTIVCMNVLEHIKNDTAALKNTVKLMKKGGYFILLVPIYPLLHGTIDDALGHYRRYKPKKLLKKLKKLNLDITYQRKINALGTIGWWFAGKVRKHTIVSEGNIQRFNKIAPYVLPLEDIIHPPIGTSILIIAQKT